MKYVDVTPTWEAVLPVMLMGYRGSASVESLDILREEFLKMARLADAYNALAKAEKEGV